MSIDSSELFSELLYKFTIWITGSKNVGFIIWGVLYLGPIVCAT